MNTKYCSKAILSLLTCAALLSTASAQTVTLYSDPLAGSSSSPLNGTTPAITIGGASWTADAVYNADGSFNYNSTSNNVALSAFLPFTPTVGNIYTLSADVNSSGGNDLNNFALFFGPSNTSAWYWAGPPGSTSLIINSYGPANSWLSYGSGGNNVYPWSSNNTFEPVGLAQIVLNTTGANWTSTYIYGGLTLGTVTVSPADQAAITDIGFSEVYYNGYSSVGQINNLTLTATSVVPEPSTYAMMLGGLGMLLGMQKFRSRKH